MTDQGRRGAVRLVRATAMTSAILLALGAGPGCQRESGSRPSTDGAETATPSARLAEGATLEQALAFPDPFQRIARVAQILDQADPSQLLSIQHAFEAAPLPWGDLEYALFIEWWGRFDPREAIGYCHREVRMRHPRVIAAALRSWGRVNPQEAIESGWLLTPLADSAGWNPDFVDPFVVGWFESGRPGLEAWIGSLDTAGMAAGLNAFVRMRVLRDGPRAALEWAIAAPYSVDLQRLILATALNVVARQDPKLAIEWLDIASEKGIDVRTFAARIGRGWATFDPKGAMEWVADREFDPPMEFHRVVADIASAWLDKDEEGLHQWLIAHDDENEHAWTDLVRKQALIHYVTRRKYDVDWEALMARASEPITSVVRNNLHLWIVARWKLIDADAAQKWLSRNEALLGDQAKFVDSAIPADEYKKIRKILEESGRTLPLPPPAPGKGAPAASESAEPGSSEKAGAA